MSTPESPNPTGYNPNPSQPQPTPPSTPNTPPAFPGNTASPAKQPQLGSVGDPTGMWQKWLSMGGVQASPEEVQMFLNTLLKFLSTTLIQQSDAAAKRAAEYEKEVIEGEE